MIQRSYRRQSRLSLELTPLIDIVFILLIFFAVSTSIELHKTSFNLTLPDAESGQKETEGTTLSIDEKQTIRVNNTIVTLNSLKAESTQLAESDPNQMIILQAHKTIPYELVINVMDILRLSGLSNITLEVQKPQ